MSTTLRPPSAAPPPTPGQQKPGTISVVRMAETRPAATLSNARLHKLLTAVLIFIVACLGAAFMLVPFYLMVVMSLKTSSEIALNPWALPQHLKWINYVHTWTIEGTG